MWKHGDVREILTCSVDYDKRDVGKGSPIKGRPLKVESREKTPLPDKKPLFFGSNLRTSTALFIPQFRTRYFFSLSSRSATVCILMDTDSC